MLLSSILHQARSKKYGYSSRDKIFTVIRKVLCNIYRSRNLIGPYQFGEISPRYLTSFTRPFVAGSYGWAGYKTYQSRSGYCFLLKVKMNCE